MEIIGACKNCGNAIPNCRCNQFAQQIKIIPIEMNLKQHIADKAKTFRKEVGFSQQQVADFLDLQRVSVCNIESGKQGLTSYNLYKLACIYEKEISDFFPDRKLVVVEEIEVEKIIPRKVKKIKKRVLKFNV